MPIVTLTTDFGTVDYHSGALKGTLLSAYSPLNVVDISHNIEHFNIVQAAFVFKNAWHRFPKKTIHCLVINDLPQHPIPYVAIEREGHYFLGPDNGIFHLIFGEHRGPVYRLKAPDETVFAAADILAQACAHLAQGKSIETIGQPATELVQRISFQPVISQHQIRGSIIYVDHYGNAITNINRSLFEQVAQDRPFALYFRRHDPLTRIARHYADVEVGAPLCLFNAIGHLEVAIHMGNAHQLLGLNVEDTIQIDFPVNE